jgi:hypothetical protein
MYIKGSNLNAVSDASMETSLSQTLQLKKDFSQKRIPYFRKRNCGLYIFDCMLATTLKCTLFYNWQDTANYFNKFMQKYLAGRIFEPNQAGLYVVKHG